MIENNQATVDKPNPSSERKPKQLKKSPSDCNAAFAREEDALSSAEPNPSFSWISSKLERTEQVKETLFINDSCRYLNSILKIPLFNHLNY
jgi:hypothetical protein